MNSNITLATEIKESIKISVSNKEQGTSEEGSFLKKDESKLRK
jgi:hypothetical protein